MPTPQGNPQAAGFNYPTYGPLQQLASFIGMPGVENVYNQKVQNAAALQAFQRQQQGDANARTAWNGATGQDIQSGPVDLQYGAPYMNAIRDTNQNPYNNAYLNGSPLQQAAFGTPIPQQTMQQYKDRQAAVADNQATLQRMPQVTGPGGFNGNIPQGTQQLPPMDPNAQQGGTVLQGSAQTSDAGTYDPFTTGIPNIPNLLTGYTQGDTNRYQQGELQNTAQKNQWEMQHDVRDDKTKAGTLAAQIAGQGFFHKYPPPAIPGRASSDADVIGGLLQSGKITPQQAYDAVAKKGGVNSMPSLPTAAQYLQLQQLQNAATPSNGLFGIGAHGADPAAVANYNAVAGRYGRQPLPFASGGNGGIKSAAEWAKSRNGK